MPKYQEQEDYVSYLLRLYRSDQNGQPTWRASLESTRDGQRIELISIEALIAFLGARFGPVKSGTAGKQGERQDYGATS